MLILLTWLVYEAMLISIAMCFHGLATVLGKSFWLHLGKC